VRWTATLRHADAPDWIDVGVGIGAASVIVWIFGVVVPLSVAEHVPGQSVLRLAWLARVTHFIFRPFTSTAMGVDEIVRRLVGRRVAPGEESREELMSVVEEGEREGQFDETERDMIEAVVDFRSRTVEEIMTPRIEVQAIEYTDDLARVKSLMREIGHSRIPVYEESLDHIVGILYAKDLLRWMSHENAAAASFSLREIVRTPSFVPYTMTVRELLKLLLARRVHLAVVADEYGGTAGVVTIEDIVEEVFGEIHDEYEVGSELLPAIIVDESARTADIDGRANIDDANDNLEPIGIELPESEEYDTVGGMVMAMLGRIPMRGETLKHNGFVLTVLEAAPTRVERVRVEHAEPAEIPPGK
jgi:CBS domain containing-hemolysin-like protein